MEVKVVATEEELEEAFRIRKIVFVEEQHVPMEEEIDDLEESSTHFLLSHQGKSIGAGRFRVIDEIGKVERICVLKEERKNGAGRTLMLGIEQHAESKGIEKLKLNAQTHAIPFYSSLGYEVVSDEFLDAGIPHRTMIKSL